MKKILYLALSLFLLASNANVVQAKTVKELTAQEQARLSQITQRIEEIKKIDKSKLNLEEKKELRTELTAMKREAKKVGQGGIYLSVTALLVIIIILLIL